MIKALKYIAYVLAFILMAVIIIYEPRIADATAPTYIILICSFLGIDVAYMLKKTTSLPSGDFAPIKRGRYIFCIIFTSALFALCVIMERKFEYTNLSGTLSCLAISLMTILALFIGGAEANKLLTSLGPYISSTLDTSFKHGEEHLFDDVAPKKIVKEEAE
jgi:hypothetical protein